MSTRNGHLSLNRGHPQRNKSVTVYSDKTGVLTVYIQYIQSLNTAWSVSNSVNPFYKITLHISSPVVCVSVSVSVSVSCIASHRRPYTTCQLITQTINKSKIRIRTRYTAFYPLPSIIYCYASKSAYRAI